MLCTPSFNRFQCVYFCVCHFELIDAFVLFNFHFGSLLIINLDEMNVYRSCALNELKFDCDPSVPFIRLKLSNFFSA